MYLHGGGAIHPFGEGLPQGGEEVSKHSGAEWLDDKWLKRSHWKYGKDISPLGREVANILGQAWLGLYHVDGNAVERVDWSDPYCIQINLRYAQLSTWDFNRLTVLVVLCHDRMVRLDIDGTGPGYTRFTFHQRACREGGISERHPTMERAIEMIRNYHGDVLPVLV
jgi:hypothetical protein